MAENQFYRCDSTAHCRSKDGIVTKEWCKHPVGHPGVHESDGWRWIDETKSERTVVNRLDQLERRLDSFCSMVYDLKDEARLLRKQLKRKANK